MENRVIKRLNKMVFSTTILVLLFIVVIFVIRNIIIPNYYLNSYSKYLNKAVPSIKSKTIDGDDWSIDDHIGKVIVINFWATWCSPCIDKLPELKSLIDKYKENENIYFVNVSFDINKNELVKTIEDYDMQWEQLFEGKDMGKNSLSKKLKIYSVPTIWLINKKGILVSDDVHKIDSILEEKLNLLISEKF